MKKFKSCLRRKRCGCGVFVVPKIKSLSRWWRYQALNKNRTPPIPLFRTTMVSIQSVLLFASQAVSRRIGKTKKREAKDDGTEQKGKLLNSKAIVFVLFFIASTLCGLPCFNFFFCSSALRKSTTLKIVMTINRQLLNCPNSQSDRRGQRSSHFGNI